MNNIFTWPWSHKNDPFSRGRCILQIKCVPQNVFRKMPKERCLEHDIFTKDIGQRKMFTTPHIIKSKKSKVQIFYLWNRPPKKHLLLYCTIYPPFTFQNQFPRFSLDWGTYNSNSCARAKHQKREIEVASVATVTRKLTSVRAAQHSWSWRCLDVPDRKWSDQWLVNGL